MDSPIYDMIGEKKASPADLRWLATVLKLGLALVVAGWTFGWWYIHAHHSVAHAPHHEVCRAC